MYSRISLEADLHVQHTYELFGESQYQYINVIMLTKKANTAFPIKTAGAVLTAKGWPEGGGQEARIIIPDTDDK